MNYSHHKACVIASMAYVIRQGEIQVLFACFFMCELFLYAAHIYFWQVICGPMFSGKSTELIRRIQRYRYAGHKCVLVKHASDTRYSHAGSIITHDRATSPALMTESLFSLYIPADSSVIGIDEGQFVSFFFR